MSWIVRNLILDRNHIISNLQSIKVSKLGETILPEMIDAGMFFDVDDGSIPEEISYIDFDFENDEWHFLLQVESKIKEMYKSKQLTRKEVEILWLLSEGNSYKEVGEILFIGKNSIRKIFNSTCIKVAFALGGLFTNEGYIEYMTEKHNLSEGEISRMATLMESNRRL